MTVDDIVDQEPFPSEEHALEILHQEYAAQIKRLEQKADAIYGGKPKISNMAMIDYSGMTQPE